MLKNIMVDIETLDTQGSAVVVSIGAVAFDPSNPSVPFVDFYVEFTDDLDVQVAAGRTMSPSTLRWWLEQGAMAKQVFSSNVDRAPFRNSTGAGIQQFCDFVNNNGGKEALLWGNGSDFDNVILASLLKDMGFKQPWRFYNNRCYRTLKGLPGAPEKVRRAGTHHNALDDAATQAEHLQGIFKWLNLQS